jgi:hypothetical protein
MEEQQWKNTVLFLLVKDKHYEKLKFFRPPHCLQRTHENQTIVTIYTQFHINVHLSKP